MAQSKAFKNVVKLNDTINLYDFLTVAQKSSLLGGGGVVVNTELQAAIDWAIANDARTVKIPWGYFYLTTGITCRADNMEICGAAEIPGYDAVPATPNTLAATNLVFATNPGVSIPIGFDFTTNGSDTSLIGAVYQNQVLRNVNITNNTKGAADGCQILVKAGANFKLSGAALDNCWDSALYLVNFTNAARLENCAMTRSGAGLKLLGGSSTVFTAASCRFRVNDYGIFLGGGSGMGFHDCVVEGNTSEGLHIQLPPASNALKTIAFHTCHFEANGNNTAPQIRIQADVAGEKSKNILFENCEIVPTFTNKLAVSLQGTQYVTFRKCAFEYNDSGANYFIKGTYVDHVVVDDCYGSSTGTTIDLPYGLTKAQLGEEFTGTLTGIAGADPTYTCSVSRIGGNAAVLHIPDIGGTSDTNAKALTGMPTEFAPAADQWGVCRIQDNGGAVQFGAFYIATNGIVTFYPDAALSAWTAANACAIRALTFTYDLK